MDCTLSTKDSPPPPPSPRLFRHPETLLCFKLAVAAFQALWTIEPFVTRSKLTRRHPSQLLLLVRDERLNQIDTTGS